MQARNGQTTVIMGVFITLLIGLLVGITVLQTTNNQTNLATTIYTQTNESVVITNGSTSILNKTGFQSGSETVLNNTARSLTRGQNYTVTVADQNGKSTINWINVDTSTYGTSAKVTYNYVDPSYQSASSSRNLTGFIPVLIAVALILSVVAVMKT